MNPPKPAGAVRLAVVAAACALAGCGSSGGTSSATTHAAAATTSSSPSAAPATTTSSTAAPAPASSGSAPARLTHPGANLHVGQTARVAFGTILKSGKNGPSYTFAVTITAITPGTMADFKGISLTGVPKGSLPTYVKLRMTNVGSNTLKTSDDNPVDSIGAVNGNDIDSSLILEGAFSKCPQVDTPNPFAPGKSFTTCQIYFERGKVTQVGYNGSESTIDQPITWSL